MSHRKAIAYVVKRGTKYVRSCDDRGVCTGTCLNDAYRWRPKNLLLARRWACSINGGSVYRVVSKKANRNEQTIPEPPKYDVQGLLLSLIRDIKECVDANQQMLSACEKALEVTGR